ncbi:hypothetical protein [Bythopirellula polymerisocia]|uniref:PEP-CTERM protein-sorting domain-containing protein n=1 Tax=Bythopirellula polymerisocia TaxID=2528003 RepID=A0A5C6D268_9BACT|nr:hypothetical protein [Bythopirellula polymerisocia]TWU29944.1 hypothetical protein Pla144_07250 [Bythopirellula polymerisocia]
MRRRDSIHPATGAVVMLIAWITLTPCFGQSVVLESAQLGTTGRIGGTTITSSQFVGWRFETSVPVAVEQVGGHMLVIPDLQGDIFASLVRLSSIDTFPAGSPFNGVEVMATTTFRPNFPSDEFLTPLIATLIPGSYALVFGSGMFGATGGAALHNGPDQVDIPPTNSSSYIFWGVASPGQPPLWRTNLASNMRFVVTGQETAFTADFEGDGDVDGADRAIWQGAYGMNNLGDADGDGDSDGADFLAWQRQFTGSGAAMGSQLPHLRETPVSTVLPEPGAFTLFATFAIAFAARRCAKCSVLLSSQI